MKYVAQFIGRTRGAIGVFHPCEVVVEAEDQEAARLKLYDTHQDIRGLVLTEQPDDEREDSWLAKERRHEIRENRRRLEGDQ